MTVRLHDLGGDGPTVVLAHGLEDRWQCWSAFVRAAPGYRYVALDLPWRAGNDYRWRRESSAPDWLRRGLDLVDGPLHCVVGHSFGANALLAVLAGDGAPGAAVLLSPFFARSDRAVTWRTFDRSRRQFLEQIEAGMKMRLGRRLDQIDPGILRSVLDKAIDRAGPQAFLTVFDALLLTLELDLEPVTTPTLVVAGEDDASLDDAQVAALASRLPAADVRRPAGFDHFCHVRRADDVAGVVSGFLRDVLDAPMGAPA